MSSLAAVAVDDDCDERVDCTGTALQTAVRASPASPASVTYPPHLCTLWQWSGVT